MKTRTIAFGLMTVALAHVACKKVDSSEAGRAAPSAPSADSLAPGFKNNAKNSSEVGNKLKAFSKDAKSTNMSISSSSTSTISPSTTSSSPLDAINLSNIKSLSRLAGGAQLTDSKNPSDSDVMDALMDIAVNDDCGSAIKKLSNLYDYKYVDLAKSASTAIKYDGSLPAGVNKSSNDQYAAIYSQVGVDDENQPVAYSIGFGSNDDKAVIAGSADGKFDSIETEGQKQDAHVDILTAVTKSTKLIEESMIVSTSEGMKLKYLTSTTGGDAPSIKIAQDISYKDKQVSGNLKITKTGANSIEIQGTQTKNGEKEDTNLKLTADASGKCVAKK